MKYLLKSSIFVALLGFAGFAFADTAAMTINKGDTAWMIVATVLVILMVNYLAINCYYFVVFDIDYYVLDYLN